MVKDYGFDLPDERYSYYDKEGELVSIHIIRDWVNEDEFGDLDEPRFKVRFKIVRGDEVTNLPYASDESKAIEVAKKLYPMDRQASMEHWESESISRAERRMGA